MKRSWFSIAAVLSLLVVVSIASAQSQYGSQPSGTSTTQSTDASTQTQTTDPSSTPSSTTPSTTTENATTTDASTLPSTASPMPLVGVVGLMTLAAGLWVARMRQKKA